MQESDMNDTHKNTQEYPQAYKLADEVMEHYKAESPKGFNVNWMKESANMIRQQADRIAELEKSIELVKDAYCQRDSETRKLKGRIAELEKQIQNMHMDEMVRLGQEIDNEPVAWMNEVGNILSDEYKRNHADYKFSLKEVPFESYNIPLYTKPNSVNTSQERVYETENQRHKPLSNEEIYMFMSLHIPIFNEPKYDDLMSFARAIEDKHGIR